MSNKGIHDVSQGNPLAYLPYEVMPTVLDVLGGTVVQFTITGQAKQVDGRKVFEISKIERNPWKTR